MSHLNICVPGTLKLCIFYGEDKKINFRNMENKNLLSHSDDIFALIGTISFLWKLLKNFFNDLVPGTSNSFQNFELEFKTLTFITFPLSPRYQCCALKRQNLRMAKWMHIIQGSMKQLCRRVKKRIIHLMLFFEGERWRCGWK